MATICLMASTLYYPNGGGHLWVFLNWALGLKKNGNKVIWLEKINSKTPKERANELVLGLKNKLKEFDFDKNVALWLSDGKPDDNPFKCISVEEAAKESDALLNQEYTLPSNIIALFKKTVLLDIDPGLLQNWIKQKTIKITPHDFYFTIGENIADRKEQTSSEIDWLYTPPCVSLDQWPIKTTQGQLIFSTITHWNNNEWELDEEETFDNNKRAGFFPFFDLPINSPIQLELAVLLGNSEEEERLLLKKKGWKVIDSHTVSSTPLKYKQYIQNSSGEFSCVKPSCIRFQKAWISDRTLCYLASGKPAIIQHTGPSKFLPDDAGLLRFKTFKEAIQCLEEVSSNYEKHCILARQLAEEYFDAKKVTAKLLEIVI